MKNTKKEKGTNKKKDHEEETGKKQEKGISRMRMKQMGKEWRRRWRRTRRVRGQRRIGVKRRIGSIRRGRKGRKGEENDEEWDKNNDRGEGNTTMLGWSRSISKSANYKHMA